MIIDTHVHMYDGGWPPGSQTGLSAHQMLDTMDRFNISKVWISSVSGLVRDCAEYNDRLYEFTKLDPDRLIRFYSVNPNYPENVVEEIKRCSEDLGCKGIKLHPWLQAFSVTYSIVNKIVETCIKYNLPIIFHDGTPPYSDCLQIANLAELYPEAKIILGHSGLYDFYRNAVSAVNRFKNVYLCLCGPAIGDIKYILSRVDNNRLIYGSDFGTAAVITLQERIKTIEYAVEDQEIRRKILYDNALTII